MEKRIEDYLHLYLGCRVAIAEEQFKGSSLKLIGICDMGCQVVDEGIKLTFYVSPDSIKLLLRPLESMTEAEMQECGNMEYDFRDDPELNKWEPSDFEIGLSPRQFHWLLSEHFDLFGLIKARLAFDLTRITS